jgi:hypothetical protein
MIRKVLFVLVGIVILGFGFGYLLPKAINADDTYYGNISFASEDDYVRFKQEIVNSKANWLEGKDKIEVLSSAPPILVAFRISINQDYDFPYGEKFNTSVPYTIMTVVLTLSILFLVNFFFSMEKE